MSRAPGVTRQAHPKPGQTSNRVAEAVLGSGVTRLARCRRGMTICRAKHIAALARTNDEYDR